MSILNHQQGIVIKNIKREMNNKYYPLSLHYILMSQLFPSINSKHIIYGLLLSVVE